MSVFGSPAPRSSLRSSLALLMAPRTDTLRDRAGVTSSRSKPRRLSAPFGRLRVIAPPGRGWHIGQPVREPRTGYPFAATGPLWGKAGLPASRLLVLASVRCRAGCFLRTPQKRMVDSGKPSAAEESPMGMRLAYQPATYCEVRPEPWPASGVCPEASAHAAPAIGQATRPLSGRWRFCGVRKNAA